MTFIVVCSKKGRDKKNCEETTPPARFLETCFHMSGQHLFLLLSFSPSLSFHSFFLKALCE